jgi:hypothetical protein
MVNIPSGMFTSFLANTPWSSVLMKMPPTMPTLSVQNAAFRRKRKSHPVSNELTRTA